MVVVVFGVGHCGFFFSWLLPVLEGVVGRGSAKFHTASLSSLIVDR